MMFRNILVPLDGSPQAEATLPVVAYLARKCNSQITLLHVVERHPPGSIHGQPHLHDARAAYIYLGDQALLLKDSCGKVVTRVMEESHRSLAESIIQMAVPSEKVDLIALCKHGPQRFPAGIRKCLAQQVSAQVEIPLLVRCVPPDLKKNRYQPRQIALILDTDAQVPEIMDRVKNFALLCGLRVFLLMLYPEIRALGYPGTGLGTALIGSLARANLEQAGEARSFGQKYGEFFQRSGLDVRISTLPCQATDRISHLLQELETDLVFMARPRTGQTSPARAFAISRQSSLPAILVPA